MTAKKAGTADGDGEGIPEQDPDMLDNYLVRLTDRSLTPTESHAVSELLHALGDFERIGDYAVNISGVRHRPPRPRPHLLR